MGNKKKIGKARRDKFYQLAKETGYRARSAFKLIQLNRKFEFLQKSRVVIDLCAAPGGWLQVVAENTPVSSLIIGVDLVPIKPIPKVITFQEDITSEKCRQELKKELHTWKADCVLNDGAPNVGKNWLHDAFQQAQLTLQALKLATLYLKKGGWFVTKVFRSKDYNSLLWVFQQLFKHVHATKPQASRNESAEIFVVCQYYTAPDKIDPKFLDPKYVFQEVEKEKDTRLSIDLLHPEKKRRQREGYPEGDYTLYHKLNVTDFLKSGNYLELLAESSEVVLDDERIANHPQTTPEIKECLTDIKVLGKTDIRMVINWRKKMKKVFEEELKKPDNIKDEGVKEVEEEDEDTKLEEKLAELKDEERRALKRKLKKTRREKIKLQHKMDLKMVLPDDKLDFSEDRSLFDLHRIKNKKQLDEVEEGDLSFIDQADVVEDDNSDDEDFLSKKKMMKYDRGSKEYLDPKDLSSDEESGSDIELSEAEEDSEGEDQVDEDEENPLLVSLEEKDSRTRRKMASWFEKDSFAGLEEEEDEDLEIERMASEYKKKGGVILDKNAASGIKTELQGGSNDIDSDNYEDDDKDKEAEGEEEEDEDDDDESSDSDDSEGSDYDTRDLIKTTSSDKLKKSEKVKKDKKGGFEVVSAKDSSVLKLDPVGLAIGAAMVSSRKRRREIIEDGYHRYMYDDEGLPDWFVKDERKHTRRELPVTKGDIEEYRMKKQAIDARPIKKIAESKARKKRKAMKKLEKARKKAEVVTETEDVTDREKWQQIRQIYKRAGLLSQKKKEVTYVVAKKGTGKKVRRPQGVQGIFKVVDGRMKKDNRKTKIEAKKGKGKKGRGNKGAKGGKGRGHKGKGKR